MKHLCLGEKTLHDLVVSLGIVFMVVGFPVAFYTDISLDPLLKVEMYPYLVFGLALMFGGIVCIALGYGYHNKLETKA